MTTHTNTATGIDLAPCPMPDCGSTLVGTGRLPCGVDTVCCGHCGLSVPSTDDATAVERWNRRAEQTATGTGDLSSAEFLAKRLSRVAKLVGTHIPKHFTHEQIAEVAGTILGDIALNLERRQQAGTGDADERALVDCPECGRGKTHHRSCSSRFGIKTWQDRCAEALNPSNEDEPGISSFNAALAEIRDLRAALATAPVVDDAGAQAAVQAEQSGTAANAAGLTDADREFLTWLLNNRIEQWANYVWMVEESKNTDMPILGTDEDDCKVRIEKARAALANLAKTDRAAAKGTTDRAALAADSKDSKGGAA